MIETKKIFKTNRNKLLNYLHNVIRDNIYLLQDVSHNEEKCLDVIGDVIEKMNETIYFSQDAPQDTISDSWECCLIKLSEVGSIMEENKSHISMVTDDLKTKKFLIDCNQEEEFYEL